MRKDEEQNIYDYEKLLPSCKMHTHTHTTNSRDGLQMKEGMRGNKKFFFVPSSESEKMTSFHFKSFFHKFRELFIFYVDIKFPSIFLFHSFPSSTQQIYYLTFCYCSLWRWKIIDQNSFVWVWKWNEIPCSFRVDGFWWGIFFAQSFVVWCKFLFCHLQ